MQILGRIVEEGSILSKYIASIMKKIKADFKISRKIVLWYVYDSIFSQHVFDTGTISFIMYKAAMCN